MKREKRSATRLILIDCSQTRIIPSPPPPYIAAPIRRFFFLFLDFARNRSPAIAAIVSRNSGRANHNVILREKNIKNESVDSARTYWTVVDIHIALSLYPSQ